MNIRPPAVAYIIDNYSPGTQSGFGGSKYLNGLLTRFEHEGVQWQVFTRSPSDAPHVKQIGSTYTKRGYLSKLGFSLDLWSMRSAFRGFDLVHSQSASSIPFLYLLRRKGIPTIFDCRTAFVRTSRLLSVFQAVCLALFPPTCVIFCDPISLKDYTRLIGRSAHYIPVPVDVPMDRPGRVRERAHAVLFATQLAADKGFPDLLKAAESLWQRRYEFTLHVAGDGPLREDAELAARRWAGRLKLHGMVPSEAVANLLGQVDILVNPSYWESVSRSVLEALSYGVPAIATRNGGMGLLAERDLIECVAPRDPRGLAATLRRLGSDRSRRQDLSERGWQYVDEHHRWERVFPRLRALYQDLSVPLP